MKDIIEVYSDAIISVICAVAVITLFVNIMTEYKDIILAFLNQKYFNQYVKESDVHTDSY